jgi:lipoprotein-releasing system permease protein
MGKFESLIAGRYLRSRRREVFISIITVISVLSVAVSVAVLGIVLSIMTGFEGQLKEKFGNSTAHVRLNKYGSSFSEWADVSKKILKIEGVVDAAPYVYGQAMLASEIGAQGIIVKGVEDSPGVRSKLSDTLVDKNSLDKLFTPAEEEIIRPDQVVDKIKLPTLIIGQALRSELGGYADRPLTLLSPKLSSSPQGLIPKTKRFKIVGVYRSGLIEFESRLVYMSIAEAQKLFGYGNATTGVEVTVKDLFEAPRIAENIKLALGETASQYYIQDWSQLNQSLWDAMKLEKKVYFIVLLLLILVASFSIVSTLVMMVMEKSKDIAVMKAMGAKDSSIYKIFTLQGMYIGGLGTFFGTGLGYFLCVVLQGRIPIDSTVFGLDSVPFEIVHLNFIAVAVVAFLMSTLAGIYPARRAANLLPAEIFRFE